jgi:putative Mn2+ efflux pump MntP
LHDFRRAVPVQLVTILFLAVGLAMDAFAVSLVAGSVHKDLRVRHALRMALFFGGFQMFMPVIGFLAGLGLKEYIAASDHWVAFGLLSLVGGRMIYESFRPTPAEAKRDPSDLLTLTALSLATSIDALAVGITFSLLKISLALAVSIIGVVTFSLSYVGVFLGKRFGHLLGSKVEILGGLILIAIGVKILIEHLTG